MNNTKYIFKHAAILFLIAFVCSLMLVLCNHLTKDKIAYLSEKTEAEAKAEVLPSAEKFEDAPSEKIVPENIPLAVLYEDEDILAVSKPKNMPVHPSLYHYTGTLGNAVLYRYRDEPFVFRPITRLDIDTTGIVLIARNRLSAQILSEQMQKGSIQKTYFALLSKTPPQKEGVIDAPIGRSGESIIKREVRPDGKEADRLFDPARKPRRNVCRRGKTAHGKNAPDPRAYGIYRLSAFVRLSVRHGGSGRDAVSSLRKTFVCTPVYGTEPYDKVRAALSLKNETAHGRHSFCSGTIFAKVFFAS